MFDNKKNIHPVFTNLILLQDETNNGVICSVDNQTVAVALALSSVNIRLVSLPTYSEHVSERHRVEDFDDIEKNFYLPNNWDACEMPEHLISQRWKELRWEFLSRKSHYQSWYITCRSALLRTVDNVFLSENLAFMIDQINQCQPENNYFTDIINNYAIVTGCDSFTGYEELKMLIDSEGERKARIMSVYLKHRNIMIKSDFQDLPELVNAARRDLYENSFV